MSARARKPVNGVSSRDAAARRAAGIVSALRAKYFNSREKCRMVFRQWDSDGSGAVDRRELQQALQSTLGTKIDENVAQYLMESLGGRDVLPYEQLVAALTGPERASAVVAQPAECTFTQLGGTGDPTSSNLRGGLLSWSGNVYKRTQGLHELASLRHASVYDVSTGRGADTLAETAREARAARPARSPSPPASSPSEQIPQVALPDGTRVVSDRQTSGGVAAVRREAEKPLTVPSSVDLSLTARSRVPPAREAPTGAMSAASALHDPFTAAADTGIETVVVGHIGQRAGRSAVTGLLQKQVERMRMTGRGPLEGDVAVPTSPVNLSRTMLLQTRQRALPTSSSWQPERSDADARSVTAAPESFQDSSMAHDLIQSRRTRLQNLGLSTLHPGELAPPRLESPKRHGHVYKSTRYLIAPPPNEITSHSAEDPSWHYASSASLMQAGMRPPEQSFNAAARLEKTETVRAQLRDYEQRVADRIHAERVMEEMDIAQRVARKQAERSVYKDAITARKERLEKALFTAATGPSETQVY